jgi:PST family polysaccharide transporter
VTLAGTIVLARILLPADFGTFAVVVFLVTAVSVIGDLGVGGALIQQNAEPDERELSTAWLLQQALWLSLFLIVVAAAPALTGLLPGTGPEGVGLVRVMAISLIFTSLRSMPTVMLTRELRFGALALIEVTQQIVFYAAAIGLALWHAGAWSFVLAAVLQTAVGAALSLKAWRFTPIVGFDRGTARRLLAFGAGFQGSYVLHWLRDGSVPLFGGVLGGATGIGLAQFSWRNGQLVSSLDEVIARVTMPIFSRMNGDRPRLRHASRSVITAEAIIIGGVQWWLAAAAPTLIPLVFSTTWTPAVPALQLVAIGAQFSVHARLLRTVLFAIGASGLAFRISALSLVALFGLMAGFIAAFGLIGVGIAFLVSSLATLGFYAWVLRRTLALPVVTLTRVACEGALGAASAVIVLRVVNGPLGLLISLVLHLAIVVVLTLLLERTTVAQLRELVRRGLRNQVADVPART